MSGQSNRQAPIAQESVPTEVRNSLMCIDSDRPVIAWLILVYDQTAEERFPLQRKWYRFNYSRATDDELSQVVQVLSKRIRRDPFPNPGVGTDTSEAHTTFQLSSRGECSDNAILPYRHLFEGVPDENHLFVEEEASTNDLPVMLHPTSYIEDENERPITRTEMLDREARRGGGENALAIVYDQPESILRFGPVEPIKPELWSPSDAELLEHFFDVYRQLSSSRWLKSDFVVSPSEGKTVLPLLEDCMAVILLFRQLYSSDGMDNLLNRCCKIHNRHSPKGCRTFHWVKYYQNRFNTFLQEPIGFPLPKCSLSAQRYLEAFAYGANMIHASSKRSAHADDCQELLTNNRKELVVMGYHSILQTLLGYVSMLVPVIQQDTNHWTGDREWARGEGLGVEGLFGE